MLRTIIATGLIALPLATAAPAFATTTPSNPFNCSVCQTAQANANAFIAQAQTNAQQAVTNAQAAAQAAQTAAQQAVSNANAAITAAQRSLSGK